MLDSAIVLTDLMSVIMRPSLFEAHHLSDDLLMCAPSFDRFSDFSIFHIIIGRL